MLICIQDSAQKADGHRFKSHLFFLTVSGELCCVALPFCCAVVVVPLPFSASIMHTHTPTHIQSIYFNSTCTSYTRQLIFLLNACTCMYVHVQPYVPLSIESLKCSPAHGSCGRVLKLTSYGYKYVFLWVVICVGKGAKLFCADT